MRNTRWKRQERAIARLLGSVRNPNTGRSAADIQTPSGWAVQVKTRGTLPAWLWAAVDQAARDAAPSERPAVVLSEVTPGKRARRLVVLEFDTWAAEIGTDRP